MRTTGIALNRLTSARYRDPIAATPWHKHVPARLDVLDGNEDGELSVAASAAAPSCW